MIEYRIYIHDFDGDAKEVAEFLDFPDACHANRGERNPEMVVPRRNSVMFSVDDPTGKDASCLTAFAKEVTNRRENLRDLGGETTYKIALIVTGRGAEENVHVTVPTEISKIACELGCEIDVFVSSLD
ncbi:hypothetical protein [Roseovarius sp.]|uniref:hypothetical protein n=1 Tax=Roseovarius sp. TaxID=1486281 RepID=UPI00263596E1|nr:hypothetical protein [Roseovarius sp.]MDM8165119.1 hypothetical protein [Roseovarius sp.]